ADFITYLEQGKVMATKCKKCQINYFPPQVDCPKCMLSDVDWFEVKGNGKLLTYSMVNYGPLGFEDKAPYFLGVGEFADGVKIFATLSKNIKETDIKVGMAVKAAPVKSDNKIYYELQAAG
ncbi:MAG: Zn-ribbon domain-containing OB-fold protein, partial [Syntrophales bacterium]|nr:Zn-ribbon domain-containing OB-fold protein [Syntrophales bacterium]